MTARRLLFALAAAGLLACGRPSRYAGGSGYGVGLPRSAFTFGTETQGRGGTRQGFAGQPSEYSGPVHVSNEARPRTGAAPR